jgi:protein-L-isoaspartate O-methyltransferase
MHSRTTQINRRDFGADDDGARSLLLPDGTVTTISEEQVVQKQLSLARLERDMLVLEVGCGTGYLCARLVEAVGQPHLVHAIDILPAAVELTRANLHRVGIDGVHLYTGNGLGGVTPPSKRFDRIILSCAVSDFPWQLVEQLAPKGIMVVPVARGWPALFDGLMLSVQRMGKRKALNLLEMTSAMFMTAEGTPPTEPLVGIEVPSLFDDIPNVLMCYNHASTGVSFTIEGQWQETPLRIEEPFLGSALRQVALRLSVMFPEQTCILAAKDQPAYLGVGLWQPFPFSVAIATHSQRGTEWLGTIVTLGDQSVAAKLLEVAQQARLCEGLCGMCKVWTPERSWRVSGERKH